MKYCPKCGKELYDEAIMCPSCNYEFGNYSPVNSNTDADKPIKGTGIGFILGFFIGLIGLILGLCLGDDKAKKGSIIGFVVGFVGALVLVIFIVVITIIISSQTIY